MRQADLRFHAASTMKVPVLIELARRVEAGGLVWNDSWQVRNRFASIVEGSGYTLSPADDSDSTLYAQEGQAIPVGELARLMIVRSSNLATLLLAIANGWPYALVVLTRGYPVRDDAMRLMGDVARMAHTAVLEARRLSAARTP